MKCPGCGGAELVHDVRDIPMECSGVRKIIPEVEGDYCPSCGEVLLDRVNGDRYSAMVSDFERSVPRLGLRNA